MKTVCLYFQVHQPFRFQRYRFFEIGHNHYYYDDYSNESILRKVAAKSYLPANKLLLDIFKEYGCRFKVAFSISGTALDQFELYAPDVLESFQKLAKTGCVEFLAETYSHSLSSLKSREEFEVQVKAHEAKIMALFGQKPTVFRNSELIYNNEIGDWIADMGYKAAIIEGAKHILGWKSPNYVYCSSSNPRLKLLLKNYRLSDDISFRFSDKHWDQFPLTADKFVHWIKNLDPKEETLNLFLNYDTFGNIQSKESGIFEFLKAFPRAVMSTNTIGFSSPSDLVNTYQPVASLYIPHPTSWADEERDVSAWLGNELQKEAFNKLYALRDKVLAVQDEKIQIDWKYLQTSDHFYYMNTKFFIHGSLHSYFNPYNSPYDAFINYMNVLSDFEIRISEALKGENEPASQQEIEHLLTPSMAVDQNKSSERKVSVARKAKKLNPKEKKVESSVKAKPASANKVAAEVDPAVSAKKEKKSASKKKTTK